MFYQSMVQIHISSSTTELFVNIFWDACIISDIFLYCLGTIIVILYRLYNKLICISIYSFYLIDLSERKQLCPLLDELSIHFFL